VRPFHHIIVWTTIISITGGLCLTFCHPNLDVQFLRKEQHSLKALQAKERSVTNINIHRTGTPKAVHLKENESSRVDNIHRTGSFFLVVKDCLAAWINNQQLLAYIVSF
jgi:hypothetical protein